MRNIFLAAGVAALAISVPAASKPGENKGNQGGGQSAQQHQHGGGQSAKADRGGGGRGQAARVEHGGGGQQRQAMRVEPSDRGQQARQFRFAQADRGRGKAQEARQVRQEGRTIRPEKAQRQEMRGRGNDRSIERFAERGHDKSIARAGNANVIRVRGEDGVKVRDFDRFQSRFADNRALGLINGCPPGLDKKNNGCLPPGQAKKLVGTLIPSALRSSFLPDPLRNYWSDNDDYYYRYNNDGYLYRVDRDTNLIASLLPLFGGGYSLGQPFPYQSSAYAMPSYYQSFYPNTADNWYRYDNGYVYGIDPYSGMINNIIPTYDYGYGVGQMLPTSYSYYNLPYPYRSYYNDSDDYYYRYAPGAIYQVDRDTQLISAVASLLTGGLGVGQQLPLGYSAYNVPLSYRDQYYDTADNWYRYNNGYIYQVDPTTRLITAVIDAIV